MKGIAEWTMFIKKVLAYDGDHDGEYIVTDGEYDLLCMDVSLPLPVGAEGPGEGMRILEIEAFALDDMYMSRIEDDENKRCLIKKGKDHFSYHLQARIIDKAATLVGIGNLIIDAGGLPEGVENGDFMGFDVLRLDCVPDYRLIGDDLPTIQSEIPVGRGNRRDGRGI